MSFGKPGVGVAYGPLTPSLLESYPDSIEYVEVPYELLRHDPSVLDYSRRKPFILHCASLSIAGTVAPSDETIQAILNLVGLTNTPWLGEHLSFISAERPEDAFNAEQYAPGEPYNIGYTVSPPMNETTVEVVLDSIASYQRRFEVPLLLENPPLYLTPPGSTLSQVEFIRRICESCSVQLLLDLTHFYITSQNIGFDPQEQLARLPLDRVVEVHVSGIAFDSDTFWDNHASRIPEVILDLLPAVLERAPVRAITLEHNWPSRIPIANLLGEIGRVKGKIA
jgi:uncharacterized protein (UPF0276 family)